MPILTLEAHIDELRRKANDGTLTAAEDVEYKDFIEAVDLISIIQAKSATVPRQTVRLEWIQTYGSLFEDVLATRVSLPYSPASDAAHSFPRRTYRIKTARWLRRARQSCARL